MKSLWKESNAGQREEQVDGTRKRERKDGDT